MSPNTPSPEQSWIAHALVRVGIVASFVYLIAIAFHRNINWDEFYFLSHIHAFLEGRLDRPMQTFYVRLFGWLTDLPGSEVAHIGSARLVMTGFFAATAISIYSIARKFADKDAALIGVLAFLTSGYALAHGASFRADPMAAACLMVALAILLVGRLSGLQVAIVAGLSALALLITIKSVLYLPAFLAVLFLRSDDRQKVARILGAGIGGVGLAGLFYVWHASGIQAAVGNETAANAGNALRTTLLEAGMFPRWRETLFWALFSVPSLVLVGVALWQTRMGRQWVMYALFLVPTVFAVVFYRNAFPYFFPFIVPPLMVVAGIGAAKIGGAGRLIIVALMLVCGAWQGFVGARETNGVQRATLAELHRLFPDPVPYIDRNGMVASFPRHGFFMSGWGLRNYRAANDPVIATLIEATNPPFVLANSDTLAAALMEADDQIAPNRRLLPADGDALRQSYVHYAGAIWLAGREVTLENGSAMVTVPFPGDYRIEADANIAIGFTPVTNGQALSLAGQIPITGPTGAKVRLIWNTDAPPSPEPLPTHGLYAGFWSF